LLVVDATHGGLTLSEEYARRGHEVVCADVHGTADAAQRERAETFSLVEALPPLNGFDLVVSPVHFPRGRLGDTAGAKVITHHQAVRALLEDEMRCPVVEMTGSFGKTETMMAAIHLLKGKRSVLALTSNGILLASGGKVVNLSGMVSSTPANIIKAVRLCRGRFDTALFEVSLGGTGLADLGIIKNVYDNYSIAEGTLTALDAKLSMVRERRHSSTSLVNADDPLLSSVQGAQMFSAAGRRAEVSALGVRVGTEGVSFAAAFEGFRVLGGGSLNGLYRVESSPRLVGRQHVENLLLASAVATFLGAAEEIPRLAEFEAGEKMVMDNSGSPKRVLNISSSIGPVSLRRALEDFCEVFPGQVSLCFGGTIHTTCGYLDLPALAGVLDGMPQVGEVALFGEVGDSLRPFIKSKRVVGASELSGDPILYVERR